MALSVIRTPVKLSSSGAGSTVRESDIGDLDHLQDVLCCQLAASIHRKLGRTTKPGQVHWLSAFSLHTLQSHDHKAMQPRYGPGTSRIVRAPGGVEILGAEVCFHAFAGSLDEPGVRADLIHLRRRGVTVHVLLLLHDLLQPAAFLE